MPPRLRDTLPELQKNIIRDCIKSMTVADMSKRSNISELVQKLKAGIGTPSGNKITTRIDNYRSTYQANYDAGNNQPLHALKVELLKAMRKYFNETYDKFFDKKDRAASEKRLTDCSRILDMIQFSKDEKTLNAALSEYLKNIKTGFFGGSLLRDKLTKVQENFKLSYLVKYPAI